MKSSVVGRPILLALEEIDGSPSFLEKALQFLETYGESWPPSLISFLLFHVLNLISLFSVVCPLESRFFIFYSVPFIYIYIPIELII